MRDGYPPRARKEHLHPKGKHNGMRARLIFTALVAVVAMLTVGAATGVAQQGLDSSDSSAGQQYGTTESLGVIGEVETVEPTTPSTPPQTPPATQQAPAAPEASGNLPFTGFAALTTLVLGLALLGGGLMLRRTSRRGHDVA